LDGSQYFDVINRMQQQLDMLQNKQNKVGGGGGGDHIGETFFRSERIVSRSAANMATSILTINDPLQSVATGLLQFEHATKLGLGLAVGLAIGIAAFEVLHKQIEATRKAEEELDKDLARPKSVVLKLSSAN